MTLSSSHSPVLQLCLGPHSPQNIGRGSQGADATPVTIIVGMVVMLMINIGLHDPILF